MDAMEMLLKRVGFDPTALKAQVEEFQTKLVGTMKYFDARLERIENALGVILKFESTLNALKVDNASLDSTLTDISMRVQDVYKMTDLILAQQTKIMASTNGDLAPAGIGYATGPEHFATYPESIPGAD